MIVDVEKFKSADIENDIWSENFKSNLRNKIAFPRKDAGSSSEWKHVCMAVELAWFHMLDSISSEKILKKRLFDYYADQWEKNTAHFSFIYQKTQHPAFREIIDMGEEVIPYLLSRIEKNIDWIYALIPILEQTPAGKNRPLQNSEIIKAWLVWGKKSGYID